MKRLIAPTILTWALLAGAVPATAAPGGMLDTLHLGDFVCELPGDADGPVGIRVPENDFTITNASSYRTPEGEGAYLLTGDTVVMTSGPLRNEQFHRISDKFLRKLDSSGHDTRLRCILRVANNDRNKG